MNLNNANKHMPKIREDTGKRKVYLSLENRKRYDWGYSRSNAFVVSNKKGIN